MTKGQWEEKRQRKEPWYPTTFKTKGKYGDRGVRPTYKVITVSYPHKQEMVFSWGDYIMELETYDETRGVGEWSFEFALDGKSQSPTPYWKEASGGVPGCLITNNGASKSDQLAKVMVYEEVFMYPREGGGRADWQVNYLYLKVNLEGKFFYFELVNPIPWGVWKGATNLAEQVCACLWDILRQVPMSVDLKELDVNEALFESKYPKREIKLLSSNKTINGEPKKVLQKIQDWANDRRCKLDDDEIEQLTKDLE